MKNKLEDYVLTVPNVLTNELCKKIIKEFEFNQTDFYGVGNAWTKHSDHLQNGKIIVLDEADTVYPDAKTMITYAKNRLLAKEHTEPFDIQPNYLIDKVTN